MISSGYFCDRGVGLDEDAREAFEQGITAIGNLSKHSTIDQQATSKLFSLLLAAYVERMLGDSLETSLRDGIDSLIAEAANG